MKEEEKDSSGVLPWAVLHVHSAKVICIGVADLLLEF